MKQAEGRGACTVGCHQESLLKGWLESEICREGNSRPRSRASRSPGPDSLRQEGSGRRGECGLCGLGCGSGITPRETSHLEEAPHRARQDKDGSRGYCRWLLQMALGPG